MARPFLVLVLAVALSGCGRSPSTSPTAPGPSAPLTGPDLSGTVWSGYLRVDACSSGQPYWGCLYEVGALHKFLLTIEPVTLAATLDSAIPETFTARMTNPVVGSDGWVAYSGRSTDGKVVISELRIHKDLTAGLVGSLRYVATPHDGESRAVTATIPSASLGRDLRLPGTGGAPALAGTWSGIARIDACVGAWCGRGLPSGYFSIVIQEASPGRFTALLDFNVLARKIVRLEGGAQPDGTVRFSGPWQSDTSSLTGEFRHLTLRTDAQSGLAGSFEYFENASWASATQTGTIVSASRVVVLRSPGSFQGRWWGDFIPRTCSGDCSEANVGYPRAVYVDLSEIGTRVEGLVSVRNRVPVTGSVSGGSVSLSGEYLVEPCLYDWEGRFCTQRVRNFSATVDAAGEMHGTMEYSEEGWGRIHYRYTVTGEFRNLLRRYD